MTLDIDAVRTFVLVADLNSFTRAAEVMGTKQGAVSVRLKRLEDRIGHKLIERTPRNVRLSAKGAAFLPGARELVAAHERALAGLSQTGCRFSLGIASHVAGPEIPTMLARMHAQDPSLEIEVWIDNSCNLIKAFAKGDLDAAIVWSKDDRRDGEVLAQDRFGWFAAPSFQWRDHEPLRLAALAAVCGVQDIATEALDAEAIAWKEVFLGGGSSAVLAAVSAGLAVAALSYRLAPRDVIDVGERLGLPALPSSEIVLHSTLTDPRSRATLRTLAAAFREHR